MDSSWPGAEIRRARPDSPRTRVNTCGRPDYTVRPAGHSASMMRHWRIYGTDVYMRHADHRRNPDVFRPLAGLMERRRAGGVLPSGSPCVPMRATWSKAPVVAPRCDGRVKAKARAQVYAWSTTTVWPTVRPGCSRCTQRVFDRQYQARFWRKFERQ